VEGLVQQSDKYIIPDGSAYRPYMTRRGELFIADWIQAAILEGYGFIANVGSLSTPIVGGGDGTENRPRQPEELGVHGQERLLRRYNQPDHQHRAGACHHCRRCEWHPGFRRVLDKERATLRAEAPADDCRAGLTLRLLGRHGSRERLHAVLLARTAEHPVSLSPPFGKAVKRGPAAKE